MWTDDAINSSNRQRPTDIAAHSAAAAHSMRGDVVDEKALLVALRAGHEWAFETMIRVFGGACSRSRAGSRGTTKTPETSCSRRISALFGA